MEGCWGPKTARNQEIFGMTQPVFFNLFSTLNLFLSTVFKF